MLSLYFITGAWTVQTVTELGEPTGREASGIIVRTEGLWYAVRHVQAGCMLCVCVCRVHHS
jgi:hypothetical protein